MTTIAYRDGIISTDGRVTAGGEIVASDRVKKIARDGVSYYSSGDDNSIQALINCLSLGCDSDAQIEANALMVDGGRVYICGTEHDGKVFRCEIKHGEFRAIGSGREYAMGAMAAGCSAKEAVKVAATLDIYTGGKIRTHKV